MKIINSNQQKGFTLFELLVSIAIFAMMTALLLTKYGNFNQGVLLTNLAYDVALTIRNAQSYGLNVKSASRSTNQFQQSTGGGAFGVHFDTTNTTTQSKFIFFVDANNNGLYDATDSNPADGIPDELLSTTNIKRGSLVSAICAGTSSTSCVNPTNNIIDVSFKRPDPNAIIKSPTTSYTYVKITLKATDNTVKNVEVRSTGQISVP